jgi:hypothetical protein
MMMNNGASAGNPNIDFINMMIPHHEAAIGMVKDFENKVTNPSLAGLMVNIKHAQDAEINQMKAIKAEEESKPKADDQPANKEMMIPESLHGKELLKFLVANKEALAAKKKSIIKECDPVSYCPQFYVGKDGSLKAAGAADIPEDATKLKVKVVANAANWCDSQMDVLIPGSAKRTIKNKKGLIPHLKDHGRSVESHVGDVQDIYLQDVKLSELGLDTTGSTECIIMESLVRQDYNKIVFTHYKSGKINQHSIGLRYVTLELAVNDKDSEKEYDFWKKYIDQVINKEVCEKMGFFWVVKEIELMENSCVLFGANILTPTLSASKADPVLDTQAIDPSLVTTQPKFDMMKAIQESKFF